MGVILKGGSGLSDPIWEPGWGQRGVSLGSLFRAEIGWAIQLMQDTCRSFGGGLEACWDWRNRAGTKYLVGVDALDPSENLCLKQSYVLRLSPALDGGDELHVLHLSDWPGALIDQLNPSGSEDRQDESGAG